MRLLAAVLICFAAVVSTAQARTLHVGDRGADVQRLNDRLADLGYLPAAARSSDVYGERTFHAVTAFQKIDGLQRDGVAGPQTKRALRTAERPLPRSAGAGSRIDVDLSAQVALLIRGRRVVRTIAISSGKPGYGTPTGRYRVFRKELRSWSVPYSVWLPYASYFVGGVAFHAYPQVPVYAASHGCVRVPEPFAAELYRFARMGTPVNVVP